ncbi:MAG: universal stress protein [Saprospiraceae bacterium]|nr:universal stress protein [Saprospiraceae bacterium]
MARIIVPTDYSDMAERALDQALLLAQPHGDEVELLHVVEMTPAAEYSAIRNRIMAGQTMEEDRLRDIVKTRIKALGISPLVRWRVKVLYANDFMDALQKRFKAAKAKLIVMATTGLDKLADRFFGSSTVQLIGEAKLPILAIPPDWVATPLHKLNFCVTPDQVPAANKVLSRWAQWLDAKAELLYLTSLPNLAPAKADSPYPFRVIKSPSETPLYQDLVDYSEGMRETALVMFVHERNFLERIFDRSITKLVAGQVRIPLLTLPAAA